jgi:hypothetical protein
VARKLTHPCVTVCAIRSRAGVQVDAVQVGAGYQLGAHRCSEVRLGVAQQSIVVEAGAFGQGRRGHATG